MNGMPTGSLQPTWFGHVTTARDALILFEACLNGTLHHVPRRPHDRERAQLIKSGCVFIYEENASGIKRWTDGVPWSPSRILGNFLVYRELLKPFPPGEKKRATKKSKRPSRPGDRSSDDPTSPTAPSKAETGVENREQERSLIGSLVDSYGFKEGGLVKKTMSVVVNGVHHHLVSYYRIEDAMDGTLTAPSADPRLAGVEPRPDLIQRQNFRAPLDENDDTFPESISAPPPPHPRYVYTPYGRPTIMTAPSAHAPGPVAMPYSPISSGASAMHPGMGYEASSVPQSPGYYTHSPGLSSPVKQDSYDTYPSYVDHSKPERSGSYGGAPASYAYRHNSTGSIPPLMSPNTPRSEWDRGNHPNQAIYGQVGPPHGGVHSPYSSGSHPWPMSPTHAPNLPPPNTGWGPHEQTWNVHGSHNGRHNSYSSGPHSGH